MRLTIVGREAVRSHLTLKRCIPAIRRAMMVLSAGETRQTLRQIVPIQDRGAFGVMQGALPGDAPFGAKVLSVFPKNVQGGGQSHQGLMVLFDAHTGEPTHIVHAGELTAIRTAAASAVATDALARPEASRLAVLGSGEQAGMHARAICEVRPIERIYLWARSPEKLNALARDLERSLGRPVLPMRTVREAVAHADIVCTTTAASEPILHSSEIADGAHINVVGSSNLGPREIDDDLVARARFFADHKVSVLSQGAEFASAKATGLVDDSHLQGEIGEVLLGSVHGRRNNSDVTIYKSLGNIVQDLASAALFKGIEGLPVISLEC
ncbi:ornithine cyclodeaminase/alanine dehydrogenase-like protein (mu-crystallin family) [Bradyrhizobium diazoefficiens]|uniref:ornithine cyclodeaminase family protein n=1 Tax=Bradyrhizobium diazoefficiens TaxID=1355477 RepID=UPI003519D6C5